MRISHAAIAAATAVVVGVGGGAGAAQLGQDDKPAVSRTHAASSSGSATAHASATPSPSTSTTPHRTRSTTATPTRTASTSTSVSTSARPSASPTPVDRLSEENLMRERLYYDVTGHSFTEAPLGPGPLDPLGPCTDQVSFSDVLPERGLSQRERILAGSDVTRVTELLAQTRSPKKARAAAHTIVALVKKCPGVPGGDFGYGDPVTVESDAHRTVVYFAGYDQDRHHGGYIVFSTGRRVGVVSVDDRVGPATVAHLAKESAAIAAY